MYKDNATAVDWLIKYHYLTYVPNYKKATGDLNEWADMKNYLLVSWSMCHFCCCSWSLDC